MDLRTAHAMVRFGMGPGSADAAPADPAGWLLDQLRQPDWQPADSPACTAQDGLQALRAVRQERRVKAAAAADPAAQPASVPPKSPATGSSDASSPQVQSSPVQPAGESRVRALYRAQGLAAVARAVATQTPFRERLVWFWTNHFTVSLRRGPCAALAGAFVAEAIRPHITGRFQDMVLAVMRHPAMLVYLDNAGSVGPGSAAGLLSRRGLNENLARECLELHTVTPAAGYTQADVTTFAQILTGWSVELNNDPQGFVFRPRIHEPGEQTLMGRKFPAGEAGGVEALQYLANHPATYHSIATRLVCHFVADNPPPAASQRIEAILRDTGGDLGAAAAGLVTLDDAWTPATKIRTPMDLTVAAFRALDVPPGPMPPYLAVLAGLGQPLWTAPAPNGWPDTAADWSGPEAMMRRVDWAYGFSARIGDRDPMAIADRSLGPMLRPETHDAMARAGSRRDALTLLLTSPEFQRR